MKNKAVIFSTVVSLGVVIPFSPADFNVHAQLVSTSGSYLVAQNSRKQVRAGRKKPAKAAPAAAAAPAASSFERVAERRSNQEVDNELRTMTQMIRDRNFSDASRRLFVMSRSPKYSDRRMEIRYLLGLSLFEMGLYQTSAFQFIAVIRDGNSRYVRQALEKLSVAADKLNDDTMLNYALSRVKLEEFPQVHQNMLRFRIGESQLKSKLYDQAARTLASVSPGNEWFSKAKYLEALSYVESGKLNDAVKAYADLADAEKSKGVNHINRVGPLMGLARVYYQQQNWDAAIDIYRQIPRDSELWHDTLFEMSWAQMRSAQFRNVLSNFHSLHSPYYEDFYIPESILLRAIVYLYICQYDEMEKTLDLFDRIYQPVLASLTNFLKAYSKPLTFYDEVAIQQDNFEDLKKNRDNRRKFSIPFLVARHIMQEGDYARTRSYIMAIRKEMTTTAELPGEWKSSELGQYSDKLLKGRLNNARKVAGVYVRNHVNNIRRDLAQLFEQHGFARFEMLSGRKEDLKKKIAGKQLTKKVDDDNERDYFVQNGFEYWPFEGEYWLDEIGNYHYLGTQSCE